MLERAGVHSDNLNGIMPAIFQPAGRVQTVSRYVRWAELDPMRERSSCCWLDRQTGKLTFWPVEVDPN